MHTPNEENNDTKTLSLLQTNIILNCSYKHTEKDNRTGTAEPVAPKKMLWARKFFAEAPNTWHVGLLTSRQLAFWAPWDFS